MNYYYFTLTAKYANFATYKGFMTSHKNTFYKVKAKSIRGALQKISRETGLNFRKSRKYADSWVYNPIITLQATSSSYCDKNEAIVI